MLESKRIYLRNISENDAPILLKWGKDQSYHDSAGFGSYENLAKAKKAAKQYTMRKNSYLICLKENDQVVGLIELNERGMDERSGLLKTKELGFLMDKDYRQKGLMTEAINLVVKDAFINLDQNEIWAGTFENNLKSQNLLKKLGFKYIYEIDYSQISDLFSYKEKYYLLKKTEWLKIEQNTKS